VRSLVDFYHPYPHRPVHEATTRYPHGLSGLNGCCEITVYTTSKYLNISHPPPIAYPHAYALGLANNMKINFSKNLK